MKSHITKKEQSRLFDDKIKQLLTASRQQGIKIGTVAVSSLVREKLKKATDENAMQVIEEVIKFCEIPLEKKNGEVVN